MLCRVVCCMLYVVCCMLFWGCSCLFMYSFITFIAVAVAVAVAVGDVQSVVNIAILMLL